eukprot:TRINITY_DN8489_c0_g1_i2.p1 TRINITY_DN8489_c0_g1~~TRINITY_DN8489_c0_g1_i2.p1  ORF type:complete len:387 (+),score=129.94 TRINITY_DN8489_c0_g1_i2:119-1279(+)
MEFHNPAPPDMRNFKDSSEAHAAMREGKKALNPWCCFKPDYLTALSCFKLAADTFARTGNSGDALDCYKNLAICSEKIDDLFGAAVAHKEAGYIHLEKGEAEKARGEFEECVRLLNVGGKAERVQDTLIEFARRCGKMNCEKLSEEYYQEVMQSVFDSENYLDGLAVIWEYSNYLIGKAKFIKALELYNKHIEYVAGTGKYKNTIAKCGLCIVCIHLILGEPYIAEEKLRDLEQTHQELIDSPFYELGVQFIEAMNNFDQAAFNRAVLTPIMSQLEVNLLKALKKVKVEKRGEGVKLEDVKLSTVKQESGKQVQEEVKLCGTEVESDKNEVSKTEEKNEYPTEVVGENKAEEVLGVKLLHSKITKEIDAKPMHEDCLLYTSPSPRD